MSGGVPIWPGAAGPAVAVRRPANRLSPGGDILHRDVIDFGSSRTSEVDLLGPARLQGNTRVALKSLRGFYQSCRSLSCRVAFFPVSTEQHKPVIVTVMPRVGLLAVG